MPTRRTAPGHYLIASDFDQTLSFNDSGIVLSELIGASNFREKVSGLSDIHLVQQGSHGLVLQEWDKARTDWVTLRACPEVGAGVVR